MESFRCAVAQAFRLTLCITLVLNAAVYLFLSEILAFLQIPELLCEDMRIYLEIIFGGILATFLYDFLACLLRAAGDSVTPLVFLAYALCDVLGKNGIWIAIPIGWLAADLTGYGYYMLRGKILRKPSRF